MSPKLRLSIYLLLENPMGGVGTKSDPRKQEREGGVLEINHLPPTGNKDPIVGIGEAHSP